MVLVVNRKKWKDQFAIIFIILGIYERLDASDPVQTDV